MKHLIVGVGIVGDATGYMLKYLKQDVVYYDIDDNKLKGRKVCYIESEIDVIWICTAEWDIDSAIKPYAGTDKIVVIRSTTKPGETVAYGKKYHIKNIAHIPEFLRANSARLDAITPDRVVIGASVPSIYEKLCFLNELGYTYYTYPNVSEMIKLVANAYLSTQISFWNEIRLICEAHLLEPQQVIEAVKKDKRISEYGTHNLGAFGGFCLPKDLKQLIFAAKQSGCGTWILQAVEMVNGYVKRLR